MLKKLVQLAILISFVCIINLNAFTKQNQYAEKMKRLSKAAYLNYDEDLFKKANAFCERVLASNAEDDLASYYSAYNQYRLMIMAVSNKNSSEFEHYFNSAAELCNRLIKKNMYTAEAKTLLSAAYMMKLTMDKAEAPSLAAKVHSLLDEAQSIEPNNPRVYLVRGIMLYNTPPMFGGSAEKAIKQFDKSLNLFEKFDETKSIDWGYLETLAWKGQALQALGFNTKAITVYNKALSVEPDFGWIKYTLLPKAEKDGDVNIKKTLSGNLVINIIGLENNKGSVRLALANSQQNYEGGKPFKGLENKITNKKVTFVIKNIPFGEYAAKFYHDENSNKELDKNFFGMPTEEYGFSNNAHGSFGPASYSDAKFLFNKTNKEITIEAN